MKARERLGKKVWERLESSRKSMTDLGYTPNYGKWKKFKQNNQSNDKFEINSYLWHKIQDTYS